jgi:hypothetical protein
MSRDDYNAELFRTRHVSPEVAEERGYRRYGDGRGFDPIVEADPRYSDGPFHWPDGAPDSLNAWARRKTQDGHLAGWAMSKHALPGSAFDAPIAQLRPDDPVPGALYEHDHAVDFFRAEDRGRHIQEKHRGRDRLGSHKHHDMAKYLLPPGPHGKRWDTHPRCTPDRFLSAECVFLHLEGCLKLDALVSAGEVGADVPSVTLWNRQPGDPLGLDAPESPKHDQDQDGGFWGGLDEALRIADDFEDSLRDLEHFLAAYVRAPVVVVCDRDWEVNPLVALEAFSLRDVVVRAAARPCVVAAPPGKSKGSDDFQYHGGKPGNLKVIEPRPHKARGRADFEREYRRHARYGGASERRRPADAIDRELALLDWYATHCTVEGLVRRPVGRIAERLDLSADTVRRATLRLADAGAITVEGHYHDPDEKPAEERRGRRSRAALATLRVSGDLVPALWTPTVGRWLRSL